MPRGPIGEGTRKLSIHAHYLSDYDSVVVTFTDESEAERIDAVRRDFVANISHELKTPISALRTLSDAVSVAATDPQVVKFATMMNNEVERLSHLVQEIIDLSRLQDADPLLDAITVDIDEALDAAYDYYAKTGRRVSIEYALIKDMNDHAWRADLLAEKLNARGKGWVHVNPIPLNPTPGSIWTASLPETTRVWISRLEAAGIPTTLRDTRGKEIDGACGQLAAAD